MVGVAGRSKACHTCKKRKIRCDESRPTCGRCKKADRVCEGYQRDRQFINLSALDHDTLLARAQPLTSLAELSYTICSDSVAPARDHSSIWGGERGLTLDDQELQDPKRASKFTDLFLNFLHSYFPEKTAEWLEHGNQIPASWLDAIDPSQRSGTSLDLAMSALSMVGLGRKRRNEQLQSEGLALYGRALKDLYNSLSSDDLVFQEHTLASCMALSLFEVLEVSGGNIYGWVSHVKGISRLTRLRGPALHVVEPSHHLFLGFRPTGIIHALALREPTYLGEQDWLSIPWTTQPKSDFHHLLDTMAQIPSLVDQIERFDQTSTEAQPKKDLLKQGWELHSQLERWYHGLRGKFSKPVYCERPSLQTWSRPEPDLEPIFPIFLHFETFEIARMHLFYWTSLLFLYNSILTMISSSAPTDQYSASPLLNIIPALAEKHAVRKQALDTAILIAQSMEYLLSEGMHMRGPLNTFFPLRTAMHVFSSMEEPKLEGWCRLVFEELDRRGYPFGKILSGWEWDDIPMLLSETWFTSESRGFGITG